MLVAIRSEDRERVDAFSAEPSTRYECPNCGRLVRLRNGAVRIRHFAHQPDSSCPYASGESMGHQRAKIALWRTFQSRGLRCEPEVFVQTLSGDRRADVMVWSPSGSRVAIEVQHSSISLEDIHDRTAAYLMTGIPVLWTALARPWFPEDEYPEATLIAKYAAPLWQRWIHGYNFGELWFIDPVHNVVMLGKLANANYKRYKKLALGDPIPIENIMVKPFKREPVTLGRYRFPGGRAARFC